jgi:allantoinase
MQHAVVVIRDGRIAEIGTDLVAGPHAKRIDGHNRFLIPGLIDSHVHVGDVASLDDDAIDTVFLNGAAISRGSLLPKN